MDYLNEGTLNIVQDNWISNRASGYQHLMVRRQVSQEQLKAQPDTEIWSKREMKRLKKECLR